MYQKSAKASRDIKGMVIARLEGELGNQMFQYALARHLSKKRGDTLVLDASDLAGKRGKRFYALAPFNVKGTLQTNCEYFRELQALWVVREFSYGFNRSVLECPCPNIMLHGLWQTEQYFIDVAALIREDFTFKTSLPDSYSTLQSEIAESESVCLHIRRTDCLSSGFDDAFVGFDYYQTGSHRISHHVNNPHFFVFSDDMEWCKQNLSIPYKKTFLHSDGPAIQHFQLMVKCKHFIIANSTFSWWAAWLGLHRDKVVIAPRHWFRSENQLDLTSSSLLQSDDLTPSSWLRI
jgi:hypothetical protein